MLLKFRATNDTFTCTNASAILGTNSIDYIKCHFDFNGSRWLDCDTIVAVFKSATFNIVSKVLLDSNNNCFIEPKVYKRGGTIQVSLIGDKYDADGIVTNTSHSASVAEFVVPNNIILPTTTPSAYDVAVAELEKARTSIDEALADLQLKVESGEFDGKSVTEIHYNNDGTITTNFSDGTSITSAGTFIGPKGDTGDNGVGISSVVYGQDGTLTITLSNGTTFTSVYSMKGEKGDPGEPGADGADGVIQTAKLQGFNSSGSTETSDLLSGAALMLRLGNNLYHNNDTIDIGRPLVATFDSTSQVGSIEVTIVTTQINNPAIHAGTLLFVRNWQAHSGSAQRSIYLSFDGGTSRTSTNLYVRDNDVAGTAVFVYDSGNFWRFCGTI